MNMNDARMNLDKFSTTGNSDRNEKTKNVNMEHKIHEGMNSSALR